MNTSDAYLKKVIDIYVFSVMGRNRILIKSLTITPSLTQQLNVEKKKSINRNGAFCGRGLYSTITIGPQSVLELVLPKEL